MSNLPVTIVQRLSTSNNIFLLQRNSESKGAPNLSRHGYKGKKEMKVSEI